MVCFGWLSPTAITFIVIVDILGPKFELEENMFSVGTSIEEFFRALVIGELSLFNMLFIPSFVCTNPFLCKNVFGNARF